jgi:hypothetical protein
MHVIKSVYVALIHVQLTLYILLIESFPDEQYMYSCYYIYS